MLSNIQEREKYRGVGLDCETGNGVGEACVARSLPGPSVGYDLGERV
jgi:hypothetical protein